MIHLSTQLSVFSNYYSVIDLDTSFVLLLLNIEGPLLKLPFNISNTVERLAYTGVLIFLLAFVALLIYLLQERTKKNKILQNGEQIRSDIFAKITHEFRTPLTIILGLSKQLREQKDLSGNNSLAYLSAIERQGRNLSDLVNQLLDITKLQTTDDSIEWKTGNIIPFVEMIYENYSIYARQQGVELQFFCNELEIETDFVPNYLQKILRNLLSNAIKYSEAGSKINLVLARDEKDTKKFFLKVIDQGIGIRKEDLPHIFDLFYKVDHGDSQTSSGIGLTLTRQLTEILKGTISVKSEVGKGSEFTVMLPIRRNEKKLYPYWMPVKKQQLMGDNGHQPDTNGLFSSRPNENDPRTTILLAEDNKDVAVYTRTIFNTNRYHLIYCRNGIEALEMAGKQKNCNTL